MSIKSCQETKKQWASFMVSAMFLWGVFWCVCVVSNQCCRRDQAALGRPGRLHTGMALHPPSVCFPPSPTTASYASETSHFGSSSPTLHHTPLQNTHKHVYLFAWDVLLPSNLNYTTQLCKFMFLSCQNRAGTLYFSASSTWTPHKRFPVNIWEGPIHCHAWQSTIYRCTDF